ncbi:rnf43, partial [Symbiodinium pilosum]
RDSRSRSASRSAPRRRRRRRRDPRLTFGRHNGMTYSEVARHHPGYVQWALSQPNPTGGLRTFVAWVRARQPQTSRSADEEVSCDSSGSEVSLTGFEDDSDAASEPPPMQAQELDQLMERAARLSEGMIQHLRRRLDPGGDEPRPSRASVLVAELPRVRYSAGLFSGAPHPQSCPICMEDFTVWEAGQDAEIVMTPCLHTFHVGCLQGWLKRRPECPTCRWDITDLGAEKAFDSSCCNVPQARPFVLPSNLEIVVSDDE